MALELPKGFSSASWKLASSVIAFSREPFSVAVRLSSVRELILLSPELSTVFSLSCAIHKYRVSLTSSELSEVLRFGNKSPELPSYLQILEASYWILAALTVKPSTVALYLARSKEGDLNKVVELALREIAELESCEIKLGESFRISVAELVNSAGKRVVGKVLEKTTRLKYEHLEKLVESLGKARKAG